MAPQVIHFDYDFSPYGQKTKLLLSAAGIDYQKCDQPMVLPRKDLESLGITYRRIPLLAIGKDVYADSAAIIDIIQSSLGGLPTSPADKAWETWGTTVFQEVLAIIPMAPLTPDFVKDRQTIFPILKRSDFEGLRPSGLAEFRSRCAEVENQFLTKGTFIGGDKISLADVHVIWAIRWAMNDLGAAQEAGLGKEAFPKLWKLIESLPPAKPSVMSSEDALKAIKDGEYSSKGVDVQKDDPLGLSAGTQVSIESRDSEIGSHPQAGKLVGTSQDEIVIEVDHGIRLHFPRIGYIVRKA